MTVWPASIAILISVRPPCDADIDPEVSMIITISFGAGVVVSTYQGLKTPNIFVDQVCDFVLVNITRRKVLFLT